MENLLFKESLLDKIDTDKLKEHIDVSAEIGKDSDGGVTRLAFSHEECLLHEYYRDYIKGTDITILTDGFLNTYFLLSGINHDKVIMMGSHGDTVPNGGIYDGNIGIASAIEVQKWIKHLGQPYYDVMAAIFRSEESSRFASVLGSKFAVGDLAYDDLKKIKDKNGVSVENAISKIDDNVDKNKRFELNLKKIDAFLETHAEQGKILECENCDIGVVTHIAAPHRYIIKLKGQYDHSGTTPMDMRKDASIPFGEILLAKESIAREYGERYGIVATIGDFYVPSGSMNKVPGEVVFSLDVRGKEAKPRDKVTERILINVDEIATKYDINVEKEFKEKKPPVKLSPRVTQEIENSCRIVDTNYKLMPSGAGHDAMNFAYKGVPTGMIFVPSKDGKSHVPDEYTDFNDIVLGTKVLATTVYSLAFPNRRSS